MANSTWTDKHLVCRCMAGADVELYDQKGALAKPDLEAYEI